MTVKTLNSLLAKLNKGVDNKSIFLRPLSNLIDLGKSFVETPKATDSISSSTQLYKFYFIKNADGVYVAVVLDMSQDLHWYVLPKYQRQGHLTNALKTIILPHIFQNKTEQKVSININSIGQKDFNASTNVAKKLGFTQISDSEYILKKENFHINESITEINVGISDERLSELRKNICYISRLLSNVQAEVEMKLGDSEYTEELLKLVNDIYSHTYKLEDAVYDFNKENTGC